ncbi:calponin homology domain-containing protein [Trifolium pratense]|uniref:Calponin homology domain-containing protein n=1 Tax=Trifolium pratense TaxID=57577 RepID=A0A2K3PFR0_TRIPR|nr:calponin homology domain-containing protein [Trifolium pratense]
MGFNSVYKSLQDIFPQVDSRLLRAVAIEHPKDADLAAEVVLTEIIPSIAKKLLPVTPPHETSPRVLVNLEDESEDEGERLMHHPLVKGTYVGSSSSSSPYVPEEIKAEDFSSGQVLNVLVNSPQDKRPIVVIDLEDESEEEARLAQHQLVENTVAVIGSSSSSSPSCSTPIINSSDSSSGLDLNVSLNELALSNFTDVNDGTHTFPGINGEGYLNRGITKEISWDQLRLNNDVNGENLASLGVFDVSNTWQNSLTEESASMSNAGNRNANGLNEDWVDFVPTAEDYDATTCDTINRLEKCETAFVDLEGSEMQTISEVQGHAPNAKDYLQTDFNASPSTVVGETSHVEDEIDSNKAPGQYNPACSIDMLEETIDEAKTNKATLFSSMESLISLMREVELQEKAAEQANMEVARGGSDILDRVEEYKAMLVHAKEANDMHAGEIYGEKAILATELKELQSRLASLSNERDNSLAILDEMRQSLESRLAAAEMLRKSAELEKLEKESSARTALLEQEAMMEKVVQEARRLKQDAEENSKLREFLMDRGQVVDTLQGEISVICQDIRLLKEKFDANLPLSKSFTSSQTTCILASSGSSNKTSASNAGSDHSDSSEILKITQAAPIVYESEEEKSKAEQNALLDDDWDIFDKDAELDSGAC